MAGEGEKLAQKVLELALAGNVKCLHFCLDRLLPRRTGRPVDFRLPAVNDARDVVVAMAAITTAVNDGRLTVEEAGQFVHILNCYSKAIECTTTRPASRRLNRRSRNAHDARH